jgi:hypothetical protein
MGQARDIATCRRCRETKRRCDQAKPSCSRCDHAQAQCMYDDSRSDSSNSPRSSSNDTSGTASTQSTPMDTTPCRVTKKRNRACLSCTRCHRLKVKCDKQRPCGRCAKSGFMNTCEFTHTAKQSPERSSSSSLVLANEDPEFIVASWFLRKRASGYYRALLSGVSEPFSTYTDMQC